MKLLVAGATGYTGRALVGQAVADGHDVIAHVRPGSRSGEEAAARLQERGARVVRTPWQQAEMDALLRAERPEVVFGLLGTTRARGQQAAQAGGPAETYETVDRDLTLLLLRAAAASGAHPRFVYLSSLGADRPGGNAYLRARHEVEVVLRAAALPWTIARPSFITGPDRPEPRPAERAGAVVADAALGLVGLLGARRLRDRLASLDAEALARGLLAAAVDPAMAGRVFDSADLRQLAG